MQPEPPPPTPAATRTPRRMETRRRTKPRQYWLAFMIQRMSCVFHSKHWAVTAITSDPSSSLSRCKSSSNSSRSLVGKIVISWVALLEYESYFGNSWYRDDNSLLPASYHGVAIFIISSCSNFLIIQYILARSSPTDISNTHRSKIRSTYLRLPPHNMCMIYFTTR